MAGQHASVLSWQGLTQEIECVRKGWECRMATPRRVAFSIYSILRSKLGRLTSMRPATTSNFFPRTRAEDRLRAVSLVSVSYDHDPAVGRLSTGHLPAAPIKYLLLMVCLHIIMRLLQGWQILLMNLEHLSDKFAIVRSCDLWG
jgi:hypothetical protein